MYKITPHPDACLDLVEHAQQRAVLREYFDQGSCTKDYLTSIIMEYTKPSHFVRVYDTPVVRDPHKCFTEDKYGSLEYHFHRYTDTTSMSTGNSVVVALWTHTDPAAVSGMMVCKWGMVPDALMCFIPPEPTLFFSKNPHLVHSMFAAVERYAKASSRSCKRFMVNTQLSVLAGFHPTSAFWKSWSMTRSLDKPACMELAIV